MEFIEKLDKYIDVLFDNEIFYSFMIVILIVIATFIDIIFIIPENDKISLSNKWINILYLLIIIYISTKDARISILLAIIYLLAKEKHNTYLINKRILYLIMNDSLHEERINELENKQHDNPVKRVNLYENGGPVITR
jgi:hypothetical protein